MTQAATSATFAAAQATGARNSGDASTRKALAAAGIYLQPTGAATEFELRCAHKPATHARLFSTLEALQQFKSEKGTSVSFRTCNPCSAEDGRRGQAMETWFRGEQLTGNRWRPLNDQIDALLAQYGGGAATAPPALAAPALPPALAAPLSINTHSRGSGKRKALPAHVPSPVALVPEVGVDASVVTAAAAAAAAALLPSADAGLPPAVRPRLSSDVTPAPVAGLLPGAGQAIATPLFDQIRASEVHADDEDDDAEFEASEEPLGLQVSQTF